MTKLLIPTTCPVCGGPTTIQKLHATEVLMCNNPNCGAKIESKLLQFVGPTGLDIESMSIATIRDLIAFGWVKKQSDFFNLKSHRDEWVAKKGYGEESVDKIIEAIPTSLELWRVITSANIPNVAKQTAMLLADTFVTWEAFIDAVNTGYDFTKIKGIGDTTAKVIAEFDYTDIAEIMDYLTIKQKGDGKLANMSFCITGKLETMNRDEMVKIIEANGGKVASVNKNLTYLICNDVTSTSGKSKKAKDLGVKVITEANFLAML